MAIDAESRALVVADVVQLPSRQSASSKLQLVRQFQQTVRELFVQGHDFGVIPGTDKPTLLKPGAEKLCGLLEIAPTFPAVEKMEDWERGFFAYTVTCRLVQIGSGLAVAEGVGSCNSLESRYRYRWVWPNELTQEERHQLDRIRGATRAVKTRNGPTKKYRVENDDIYSQANTILKMAKKRALVDAALSAGRLSDVFTQDIEDVAVEEGAGEEPPAPSAPPSSDPPPADPPRPPAEEAAVPPDAAPSPGLLKQFERRLVEAQAYEEIDLADYEYDASEVTQAWLIEHDPKLAAAIKAARAARSGRG